MGLWLVLVTRGMVCGAEVATVQVAQADVYRKPAKGGAVVGTLQRGAEVKVDFAISNAEGEWCSVAAVGRVAVEGYVLCEQ